MVAEIGFREPNQNLQPANFGCLASVRTHFTQIETKSRITDLDSVSTDKKIFRLDVTMEKTYNKENERGLKVSKLRFRHTCKF